MLGFVLFGTRGTIEIHNHRSYTIEAKIDSCCEDNIGMYVWVGDERSSTIKFVKEEPNLWRNLLQGSTLHILFDVLSAILNGPWPYMAKYSIAPLWMIICKKLPRFEPRTVNKHSLFFMWEFICETGHLSLGTSDLCNFGLRLSTFLTLLSHLQINFSPTKSLNQILIDLHWQPLRAFFDFGNR